VLSGRSDIPSLSAWNVGDITSYQVWYRSVPILWLNTYGLSLISHQLWRLFHCLLVIILTAWIRNTKKYTLLKSTILWDVTTCSLVEWYQLFRETPSLHHQGRRLSLIKLGQVQKMTGALSVPIGSTDSKSYRNLYHLICATTFHWWTNSPDPSPPFIYLEPYIRCICRAAKSNY